MVGLIYIFFNKTFYASVLTEITVLVVFKTSKTNFSFCAVFEFTQQQQEQDTLLGSGGS